MEPSSQTVEEYLRKTLHAPTQIRTWREEEALPAYLRNQYQFFEGTVADARVLFIESDEELVPTVAKKHVQALRERWDGPVAFVFGYITPRGRQRLIQEGLAFVVPGNQIYLPMLGMNLRERYKRQGRSPERLRPSAQVLFLSLLSRRFPSTNLTGFAANLDYTPVALGQALDQLEHAGLVRVQKIGRERSFDLEGNPVELWEKAQPLLISPVKRRRYLSGVRPHGLAWPRAGLSALAVYSPLAEPRVPVLATSGTQAKGLLAAESVQELPSAAEADLELEVWSYSPRQLSHGSAVDPLSLYLSLRKDPDERVQSALEEMMRSVQW